MTEAGRSMEVPTRSFASVIGRISKLIEGPHRSGDVAVLRRMGESQPAPMAFWRLVETELSGEIPESGPRSESLEKSWRAILSCAAILRGLHSPRVGLGRALGIAAFSDARIEKLLRGRDSALRDAARGAARFLAAKGQPANLADLALLVLSDGRSDESLVRRRIARAFYAMENSTSGD